MNSLVYLFLAYSAAILLIGGYVVYLARRLGALRSRMESLKQPEDR